MKPIYLITALTVLAACDPVAIQRTSGAAFLAHSSISDPDIAAAAALEPTPLSFPARIGVIRYVQDAVATMPPKEREALLPAFHQDLGEIVHIGPLETSLTREHRLRDTDAKGIRQLAASRHLDYVLVMSLDPYENMAEAVFLDVRTGYPHASVETAGRGRGVTNTFGYRPNNPNKIKRATLRLAKTLAPDLQNMTNRLLAQRSGG